MSDLTDRLRLYVAARESDAMGMSPCELAEEAADEIERLTRERAESDARLLHCQSDERNQLKHDCHMLTDANAAWKRELWQEQTQRNA